MASLPPVGGQSALSGFEIGTPRTSGVRDSLRGESRGFADLSRGLRLLPVAGSAPLSSSLLEFHTASERYRVPLSMKGRGLRPLPAAISAIVRPEATERSSSDSPLPLSARSKE